MPKLKKLIDEVLEDKAKVQARLNSSTKELFEAILSNNVSAVKKALEQEGIDFFAKNEQGNTPLTEAVFSKNESSVQILLDHGAHVNLSEKNGNTPLIEALHAREGTSIISLLLEYGANINLANQRRQTPLQIARLYNKSDMAEFLIQHGAKS